MSEIQEFWLQFVTKEMVKNIFLKRVLPETMSDVDWPPKTRNDGYMVVLAPVLKEDSTKVFPASFSIEHEILYEYSLGDPKNWQFDFKQIARCKALQLLQDRNFSGNMNSVAHMLFKGDTPFWGGHREGLLVAAFSGVKPWGDQEISKKLLSGVISEAEHLKQQWLLENPEACFV